MTPNEVIVPLEKRIRNTVDILSNHKESLASSMLSIQASIESTADRIRHLQSDCKPHDLRLTAEVTGLKETKVQGVYLAFFTRSHRGPCFFNFEAQCLKCSFKENAVIFQRCPRCLTGMVPERCIDNWITFLNWGPPVADDIEHVVRVYSCPQCGFKAIRNETLKCWQCKIGTMFITSEKERADFRKTSRYQGSWQAQLYKCASCRAITVVDTKFPLPIQNESVSETHPAAP